MAPGKQRNIQVNQTCQLRIDAITKIMNPVAGIFIYIYNRSRNSKTFTKFFTTFFFESLRYLDFIDM